MLTQCLSWCGLGDVTPHLLRLTQPVPCEQLQWDGRRWPFKPNETRHWQEIAIILLIAFKASVVLCSVNYNICCTYFYRLVMFVWECLSKPLNAVSMELYLQMAVQCARLRLGSLDDFSRTNSSVVFKHWQTVFTRKINIHSEQTRSALCVHVQCMKFWLAVDHALFLGVYICLHIYSLFVWFVLWKIICNCCSFVRLLFFRGWKCLAHLLIGKQMVEAAEQKKIIFCVQAGSS